MARKKRIPTMGVPHKKNKSKWWKNDEKIMMTMTTNLDDDDESSSSRTWEACGPVVGWARDRWGVERNDDWEVLINFDIFHVFWQYGLTTFDTF